MKRRPSLLALFFLLATPALARVGGGQHYSGSHSSSSGSRSSGSHSSGSWSGSSGSGSSSSSGDLWVLFFLAHPLFSIGMIAVAFVIWRAYRTSFGATTSTQRAFEATDAREPSPPSAREVTSWVDALRASDPDFDLVAFLDQVKGLFLRVQAAWAAGDLAAVRRDLSDATFQRFRVQLDLLRSQDVRNVTADMAVLDLQPVGLER